MSMESPHKTWEPIMCVCFGVCPFVSTSQVTQERPSPPADQMETSCLRFSAIWA